MARRTDSRRHFLQTLPAAPLLPAAVAASMAPINVEAAAPLPDQVNAMIEQFIRINALA